jgi:glutamate synthase (NADPH/NADH) small chain
MGKKTGFMEYERLNNPGQEPMLRIQHYNEFHKPLCMEERKKQAARCMDCGVPFCQAGKPIMGMVSGCPLNNLIPEWNDLVYSGMMDEAASRLLLTNCFPEFTSRVCPALCEKACTCGLNGEPVTVKENEYAIVETAFATGRIKPNPPKIRTGKKVAVIGSGPSGLAAALQLNKRGHSVTVYEREDRPGGLLMYGIPNMKLEKSVIERRINIMEEEGIRFKTSVNVGVDITAKELKSKYDAIILCCGASNPRPIEVPGKDAGGIYYAVDFLKSTTKSLLSSHLSDCNYISAKYKNVVVIGGGDTGNDCVGTCLRHGCRSVVQLEMMPKAPDKRTEDNPWPEWPKVCKTDYGQEEAIEVFGTDPRIYETTVKEFIKDEKGNVKAVKTVMLDTSVRPFQEVPGTEKEIKAELVLIAAGFLGAEKYITDAFGTYLTSRTAIATPEGSYKTNIDKVFAAGDVRRGQSLVVWAIQEGRSVAREVDEYLMGYSNL